MRILLATIAAAALLAIASPAQAQSRWIRYQRPLRLPDGPAAAGVAVVKPALALAQRVWHPTCGRLALSSDPVPPDVATDEDAGDIVGWALPNDCTIHLHRHVLWLGGPDLCETILHEAGHVAGFHEAGGLDGGIHSRNPSSIMYPSAFVMRVVEWIASKHHRAKRTIVWGGVDRRCRRAYHAHGGS